MYDFDGELFYGRNRRISKYLHVLCMVGTKLSLGEFSVDCCAIKLPTRRFIISIYCVVGGTIDRGAKQVGRAEKSCNGLLVVRADRGLREAQLGFP